MMGYGYGGFQGYHPVMFHGFGFLLFILVVLLVILVAGRKHRHMMAVHGAHGMHGSMCGHHGISTPTDAATSAGGSDEAVAILKRRLASGEITVEEYESVISHLG